MSWAHPRSWSGRAVLWAALLALASLTLVGARPHAAWRSDLAQEDAGRRRLAAHALRETPDRLLGRTMSSLAVSVGDPDRSVSEPARETMRMLAPRMGPLLAGAATRFDAPQAQDALDLLGHGGVQVVPAVVEYLLGAEDPRVRLAGMAVLERIGRSAADGSRAELARLTQDPDVEVRRQALRTLRRLEPDGLELFRAAQRATRDSDPTVRQRAWRALVISPHLLERARDPAVAPDLAEALERELPALPEPLRRALDEGLSGAR